MTKTNISAALLLLGILQIPASSQRPAYDPNSPTGVTPIVKEVVVDQDCRILQTPVPASVPGSAANAKPRWRRDSVVCHLESVLNSGHPEEKISGGTRQRGWVTISEQEYLLQDVTDAPVTFVVQEYVPRDWRVDSDPQPNELIAFTGKKGGSAAVFRVNAQPGQTVRLHVGLRHAEMGKPKPVKVAATAPGASGGN